MKNKLLFGSLVVAILVGGFRLTNAQSFSNSLQKIIDELARRVTALEERVVALQEELRHIQLTPGPQGPQGPAGPMGPQGEPGPANGDLHLYDANNLDLGLLVSVGDPVNANRFVSYLPDSDIFLEFRQDSETRTIYMHNLGSPLYFSSENCTGTPHSPNNGNPGATLVSHTNRVFKFTGQEKVLGNDSWSRLTNGCENGQGFYGYYYPVEEISLPFSLPPVWPIEVRLN